MVCVGHCLLLLNPSHMDTYSTHSRLLNTSQYFSHLHQLYIKFWTVYEDRVSVGQLVGRVGAIVPQWTADYTI